MKIRGRVLVLAVSMPVIAFAVIGGFMSKAIAREFGPDGITANTVAPGMIDTARDLSQYKHIDTEKLSAEIPVRRLGTPDDIAEACIFLAGEGGGFVSGQVTT